jgi:large subunit ribosomal protein L18Ae
MAEVSKYHEYVVIGRAKPTEAVANPPVFRMRLFSPNTVVARSRFWYFMRQLNKLKAANGEILAVHEIKEQSTSVKNYGVWLRYTSRKGVHNMYKEFRDVTRVGAVQQLYNDMAGRHRARHTTIQIVDIKPIHGSQVRRVNIKQFLDNSIKFPLTHRTLTAPYAGKTGKFLAKRPSTYAH